MEKDIAIMMADLTGYTAMTEAHGGASAAKMVGKYMELVNSAMVGTARLHQRIGDQVVIVADQAHDILETAQRLNKFEGGREFRQVVNIVFRFEFCVVEPKRKQALLRSNLPGIGSPDRMSLFEKDVVKSTSFFI